MRTILFTILAFCAVSTTAQNSVTINGKIIDEEGKAVEYATIGIPGTESGTLSGIDGCFTLTLPQYCNDTIIITHVSYNEKRIPAAVYRSHADTLSITMQPRQLRELIVYNGKRKRGKLMGKGMRIAGAVTEWNVSHIGCEVGSVISTDKVFEVREIKFKVLSNSLKGVKFSVNIYKANEEKSEFTGITAKPIYIDITTCQSKKEYTIEPEEDIYLEPGTYYVSLKLVDAERSEPQEGQILFPLYLKSSYIRKGPVEELEKIPMNLGLQVKGHIM